MSGPKDLGSVDPRTWGTGEPRTQGHKLAYTECVETGVSNCLTGIYTGPVEWAIEFLEKNFSIAIPGFAV